MMRRRLRSAYLSTVLSISLVLLLVGVASLLLVNARGVSDYFKEHMQISVLMKPDISDAQTLEYQVELDAMDFVLSTEFISKAQGTREMEQMLGEGFLDIFEASPIPASVNVRLKAGYVSPDSLDLVKAAIMESPLVDEVEYQQSLIEALNANLKKISLVLGILIVLLLFISFVLINNTVRLNVFARRFTIHTMKLVGATRSFIRGPFLDQAVFQGLFYPPAYRPAVLRAQRVRAALRDILAQAAADGDGHRAGQRCAHLCGQYLFRRKQACRFRQG